LNSTGTFLLNRRNELKFYLTLGWHRIMGYWLRNF